MRKGGICKETRHDRRNSDRNVRIALRIVRSRVE
jgi:hypothetical protein